MTTTELNASIAHLLDVSPWLGDFVGDYDVAAITADYAAALSEAAGQGVQVTVSGVVVVEVDQVEQALGIDWGELAEGVDLVAIAARHEITGARA